MDNIYGGKPAGIGLIDTDPWLKPFEPDIRRRLDRYEAARRRALPSGGTIGGFANGALFFGIHRVDEGWVYREWAPEADALYLFGEFNDWNRDQYPLYRIDGGAWELKLPKDALRHGQRVLVSVDSRGCRRDRIPLYINSVARDQSANTFTGRVWAPEQPFVWRGENGRSSPRDPLYIYEAHVGMASREGGVGSYDYFAGEILPRIKNAGYNAVQLMAIQEHPYYASFGYQVTNFFAPSQWYGDPDGLKRLIDAAHGMGLIVLLDVVHSHASANFAEGIAEFDGTEYQFFHSGGEGWHQAWGTRVFDYSRPGVLHFLLSNLKYWLDEYHFDGFRFDGVTSMLYKDHGLGAAFTEYKRYYNPNADLDAAAYLMLACELIHEVNPRAVAIAEDMSGMPGLCRPLKEGGFGFDARLGMGLPDFWIKTVKGRDEDWDLRKLWHELTTRRPGEKVIGYSESHDQALVGDKTLAFHLADAAMYTGMSKLVDDPAIDRALALLKCIRLLTLTLGGEGYLNFMGNEFAHPEWIDFPREGNGWSYHYARRQWNLADDPLLRYADIARFDRAMLDFAKERRILSARDVFNLWIDQERKIIAYRKAGLVFVFNTHPSDSRADFYLPTHTPGRWRACFSTDDPCFGGQGRVDMDYTYSALADDPRGEGFFVYAPCRCGFVLERIEG
ncbi:MAG: alpha amylase C-terminal domain-containing protein [Oscillospiraceae bacterium]|jgi:1,4-alpha-glucan branching enzyme|nr:alpha amylase C-terminal domain-containing protein [Oscillospiraceae bacterium]